MLEETEANKKGTALMSVRALKYKALKTVPGIKFSKNSHRKLFSLSPESVHFTILLTALLSEILWLFISFF